VYARLILIRTAVPEVNVFGMKATTARMDIMVSAENLSLVLLSLLVPTIPC